MKKANNTPPEQENPRMPLTRRNYILLAVGFAVILLGFVLMAGGGSDSPDEFNYGNKFSLFHSKIYTIKGTSNIWFCAVILL